MAPDPQHKVAAWVVAVRTHIQGWWERIGWFRFVSSAFTLFGQRRVFGLAAEAAFWATFSLPWLVLGLVASTAGVAQWFGHDLGTEVTDNIVNAAGRVLTPETIQQTLVPLLESVKQGSTGLSILGLILAVWSGSRVFATFVVGSEILNDRVLTGYVYTRALALGIYAVVLVGVGVLVVTVVQFPEFWASVTGFVPGPASLWGAALAAAAMAVALTTLLHLADGRRGTWVLHLAGGVVTLVVWLAASWGLSLYLRWSVATASLYGAIAAPVAIMLWLFVSVLALFVGMTLTATIRLAQNDEFLDPLDPSRPPRQPAGSAAIPTSAAIDEDTGPPQPYDGGSGGT